MAIKKKAADKIKEDIAVLRMEIDYHLAMLFDALKAEDTVEIQQQKVILEDRSRRLKLYGYYR